MLMRTKYPCIYLSPELVQEMIEDMKCHICEREIPNEDDSYKALLKRLEFSRREKVKWLRKILMTLNELGKML